MILRRGVRGRANLELLRLKPLARGPTQKLLTRDTKVTHVYKTSSLPSTCTYPMLTLQDSCPALLEKTDYSQVPSPIALCLEWQVYKGQVRGGVKIFGQKQMFITTEYILG